jgi:RNA polymerase sigma factor (sigma-70 family)
MAEPRNDSRVQRLTPPVEGRAETDGVFSTTSWSVVIAAGEQPSPRSREALEKLCRIYWFPLFAYLRRQGQSKEEAEDLVQAFFVRFLEKNYLEGLSAERGRFRAFLLASLKNFLANERDRMRAAKRGGNAPHLPLDCDEADQHFQLTAANTPSPDKAFDREWAFALLERVIARLQKECESAGRAEQFNQLKPFLTAGKGLVPHAAAAAALGMDEGAVRVAVHRLRKRYRELLHAEVSQTLSDPAQLEEEIRSLFAAFRE